MEKGKQKIEIDQTSQESIDAAIAALATEFHEDWRKTRKNEDGSFEPKLKKTQDEAWIAAHGTDQVDIANTEYGDLPADWQTENKAAAEVVVGIIAEYSGQIDLEDPMVRSKVGGEIHNAWLSRNGWAAGSELDVPFDLLPEDERAKDLDQIVVAQRVFSN